MSLPTCLSVCPSVGDGCTHYTVRSVIANECLCGVWGVLLRVVHLTPSVQRFDNVPGAIFDDALTHSLTQCRVCVLCLDCAGVFFQHKHNKNHRRSKSDRGWGMCRYGGRERIPVKAVVLNKPTHGHG